MAAADVRDVEPKACSDPAADECDDIPDEQPAVPVASTAAPNQNTRTLISPPLVV